jgi:hypothetical protein
MVNFPVPEMLAVDEGLIVIFATLSIVLSTTATAVIEGELPKSEI